jgi:hypothetical protein
MGGFVTPFRACEPKVWRPPAFQGDKGNVAGAYETSVETAGAREPNDRLQPRPAESYALYCNDSTSEDLLVRAKGARRWTALDRKCCDDDR